MSNTGNNVSSLSKRLECRQKYSAVRRLFSTLFSVFGYQDETLSLVFDILFHEWKNIFRTETIRDVLTRIND